MKNLKIIHQVNKGYKNIKNSQVIATIKKETDKAVLIEYIGEVETSSPMTMSNGVYFNCTPSFENKTISLWCAKSILNNQDNYIIETVPNQDMNTGEWSFSEELFFLPPFWIEKKINN